MPQLVGVWSRRPEGHGLDSQSGHMPRLWIWSPGVRVSVGGSRLMFLSLLPSFPLSLKSMHISSGEGLKKKEVACINDGILLSYKKEGTLPSAAT